MVAVQVRIDSDQPIECTGYEIGEVPGCDGFAVAKPAVLTYIGEIRCNEAHSLGAKLARSFGSEQQRQKFAIGPVQRADNRDIATVGVGCVTQPGFTIGEMPGFDNPGLLT